MSVDADLILTNGVVYTVDPCRSRHKALAVRAGRVARVGSTAEVAGLRGSRTQVVDLGGRLVLPGFVDSHLHPRFCTGVLFEIDLSTCRSVAGCLAAVAGFAAAHPELPAIRGYGWFPTEVPESEMTAAAIDAVVADRPVSLFDDSQHSQWVNTATLRLSGVGRDDPPWDGAVVERLPDGSPSGLLREAWPWVEGALPQYGAAEMVVALRHFQRAVASRYGLTLLHEAGLTPGEQMFDAYRSLEESGELTARYCVSVELDPGRPAGELVAAAVAERARDAGPLVRTAAVKLFTDGVLESHTGYLAEPYADRPGFRGAPVWAPEALIEASVAAARAGFQLHYHSIGDAATSLSLDAIAAARPGGRREDARDILTHLQVVDPRDYARMADLGVTAATQPYWFAKDAVYDAVIYRPFLGEVRAAHQYPMRSFFEHGINVTAASDFPVSPPPNPLLAIQRGALRRDPLVPESSSELWPDEAVSVERLVTAFTINGAFANFLENETGSLEVGKSADLIVLSEDILDLPPERIHEAEVRLTLFRGEPVYAAAEYEGLGDAALR
ncbi:MAG: amidohydrolase [Actinobacteria bacterium]|nr:amidohydrolase [Actinomycetota bacterium]